MIIDSSPLRVAIVGTNNDSMYSGGRYHALIMAYALARAGAEVCFITNKRPKFFDDLEPIAPGRVRYAFTGDFIEEMPDETFDYVVVVPTGVFLPSFYERVLAFARRATARAALINFESANWFNAVSPVRRDVRLWEYWRRIVADGGLVISSLRESDNHARSFYAAVNPDDLRFEICPPAINSDAAAPSLEMEKDGSVLAFVRSSDPHKGGADLLELNPAILKGRILRIVAGGAIDPDFADQLAKHYRTAKVPVEIHSAIPDAEKFYFIALAQALIVPSRFEGFGYPPVEAAYMGTETVCYDLPVFRETMGEFAHFAPVGDITALGEALARALDMPPRQKDLNTAVANMVAIDAAGQRFFDVLLRSLDRVPPLRPVLGDIAWGPFPTTDPDPAVQTLPRLPALLRSYVAPDAEETLFSVEVHSPIASVHAAFHGGNVTLASVATISRRDPVDGFRIEVTGVVVHRPAAGTQTRLRLTDAGGTCVSETHLEFGLPLKAASPDLSLAGYSGGPAGSRLDFQTTDQPDRLLLRCGDLPWVDAPVSEGRATVTLPEAEPHRAEVTIYLFAKGCVLDVYRGLPPVKGLGRAEAALSRLGGGHKILELTDDNWENGVLRRPGPNNSSVIACAQIEGMRMGPTSVGSIVRLAGNRLTEIRGVQPKGRVLNVTVPVAIDPAREAAPGALEIVAFPNGRCQTTAPSVEWAGGLWRGIGTMRGRCVLLPPAVIDAFGKSPGPLSVLDASGAEIPIENIVAMPGAYAAWLATVPALSPTDTLQLDVLRGAEGNGLIPMPGNAASALAAEAGWAKAADDGRTFAFVARAQVCVGDLLVFGVGVLRRVVEVARADAGVCALLDQGVPTAAAAVRFATFFEAANYESRTLATTNRVESPGAGRVNRMLDATRLALPLQITHKLESARPRVLFASLVPPDPADQGNRIVTRNFIAHLLRQGFDVDLLLLGQVKPDSITRAFGDRVRVFSWGFPDWASESSAALRRNIVNEVRDLRVGSSEAATFSELLDLATLYHPFFIVPDALIRTARRLYSNTEYHSIVCNYTHMLRVATELRSIRPLPPVTVITHDALSRLPVEIGGKPLDTMYRRCRPETESAALNSVKDALVLAISESERDYFYEIGVTNPITLCEYDGFGECAPYQIDAEAFDRRRLIFHASGNPMNRMAIDWFLNHCWGPILQAVPDARLVVCGGISNHMLGNTPGVEVHGSVPRKSMLELLSGASVAINPTVAGTGLKIKTVEAACFGLPSVCLPLAVEGLEAVADHFCRLARTPEEFTHHCIELLQKCDAWSDLRRSALDFAAERFSEHAIYGPCDAYMGWDKGVESRFARPRTPYVSGSEAALISLEQASERGAFAAELVRQNELGLARKVLLRSGLFQADQSIRQSVMLVAAFLANRDGAHLSALSNAVDVLAGDPTNGVALGQIFEAGLGQQDMKLAHEAWTEIALALPLSADVERFGRTLIDHNVIEQDPDWLPRRLKMPADGVLRLPDHVAPGDRLGPGWSDAEPWGAWTDGVYARLEIEVQPTTEPLRVELHCHGGVSGVTAPLSTRLAVNGNFQPLVRLDRRVQVGPHLAATLAPNADGTPQELVVIELFIDNPTPARGQSGKVIDGRHLGIALGAVKITPTSIAESGR